MNLGLELVDATLVISSIMLWVFSFGAVAHAVPCRKNGASFQQCCHLSDAQADEFGSMCKTTMNYELIGGLLGLTSW